MPELSIAPWTDAEVESLNAYQASSAMHPFTCENDDADHCASVLVATTAGWTCPDCDYTQNWATAWMANWAWRVALETGIGAWVPGCVAYDPHAERPARISAGGDDA